MNNRSILIVSIALGAAAFAPIARAQRRGGFASAPASRAGFARMRRAGGFFGGSGFSPYYDYDDAGIIEPAPTQVIFAEPPQPPPPAPKPSESLVLELQGDHWVRLTNYGQSQSGGPALEKVSALPPVNSPVLLRQAADSKPPAELPPAVLVFRDGHQEEIGRYLINGGTIYASANYWTSGSWTRKVPIAQLDVPATLKLNQERNTRFSLPSGPTEVMIRP